MAMFPSMLMRLRRPTVRRAVDSSAEATETGTCLLSPKPSAAPSQVGEPKPLISFAEIVMYWFDPTIWAWGFFLSEWAIRLVMLVVVPFRRMPAAAKGWLLLIFFEPWIGLLLYMP